MLCLAVIDGSIAAADPYSLLALQCSAYCHCTLPVTHQVDGCAAGYKAFV